MSAFTKQRKRQKARRRRIEKENHPLNRMVLLTLPTPSPQLSEHRLVRITAWGVTKNTRHEFKESL